MAGARRGLSYDWVLRPRVPAALLAALRGVHPMLGQVLYRRGLETVAACREALAGGRDPHEPSLLADLPAAVRRLLEARARRECVAVFTDYDADGVTSAAVLALGLRLAGISPIVRLLSRFAEGYGLSPAAVDELADRGAHVIVTADCGSTAHTAALRAGERGVDLIITDHHQCPPELPDAFAVVDPWRPDCAYSFDYLCGAGVAYRLVQDLVDLGPVLASSCRNMALRAGNSKFFSSACSWLLGLLELLADTQCVVSTPRLMGVA